MCKIIDKVEQQGLMLVEQPVGNATFYEIYKRTSSDYKRVFYVKNNFDKALSAYTEMLK